MKRIVILQPMYLPWIGYFDLINKSDIFVFYDDVLFNKQSWQSRNRIKTPKGIQWLSIPTVKKGRISSQRTIKDTKISDLEFTKKHLSSISSSYRKAKFFEDSSPFLKKLFKANTDNLSDFNISIIKDASEYLGLKGKKFVRSSQLGIKSSSSTQRLIDICKHFNATNYLTGETAKDYLDENAFRENHITLEFHNYKYPAYTQLWGDFIPYLSVIDLILNVGPKSLETILQK